MTLTHDSDEFALRSTVGLTSATEGKGMTTQKNRPAMRAVGSQPSTRRDHMTVADLCAELGIARSTFYDWRQAKKAPRCIKLPNGDLRIRRSDYAAWLENLEDAA